ncbi:MAG: hypothetical protein PWQ41_1359 [Bacillota bacterium]|jgi:ferredoxin|nr:hypothetical protein [Bacillota bacterium]MDK2925585.1 hypothetical protein [Bacillota bacterium]
MSLRVEGSLCVKMRSRRTECDRCLAACPTQGIRIGQTVQIESCVFCGLCTAQCPTGVFALQENSDGGILLAAQKLAARWATLVFSCDRSPRSVTRRPDRVVVRCAGRVSPELLVATLSLGARAAYLYLDPAVCAHCWGERAEQAAKAAALEAQAILGACGSNQKVTLTKVLPPPLPWRGTRAPAAEGSVDEGKRGLLKAVKGMSVKTVLQALLGAPAQERGFTWTHSLPQRRRILLEALARLFPAGAPAPDATLPWAGLSLAGGCTFCGACVPLCPSGALKVEERNGEAWLWFYPARCTSCGLCLTCCPEGALSYGPKPELKYFLNGEGQLLGRATARRCAVCGRTYLCTDPGQTHCVTCRIHKLPRSRCAQDSSQGLF